LSIQKWQLFFAGMLDRTPDASPNEGCPRKIQVASDLFDLVGHLPFKP
jgi:hypothetical protein